MTVLSLPHFFVPERSIETSRTFVRFYLLRCRGLSCYAIGLTGFAFADLVSGDETLSVVGCVCGMSVIPVSVVHLQERLSYSLLRFLFRSFPSGKVYAVCPVVRSCIAGVYSG